MKTIVHITLTDDERRLMADRLDGKESKRMVSRAEVAAFCKGAVDKAINGKVIGTALHSAKKGEPLLVKLDSKDLPPEELIEAAAKEVGKGFVRESYIRGWQQVS